MIDMLGKIKESTIYCIKKFGDFIAYILRLTYAYKLLFFLTILLAVGITIYNNTGNRKIYKGELALKINAGTAFTLTDMVNELNNFVKIKDYEGLAEALRITTEDAKSVAFIKSFYYIAINNDSTRTVIDYRGHYDVGDTTNTRVKNQIIISLGLNDRSLFPKMQTSITNYFESNEYLKEVHAMRLSNLLQREEIINKDIEKLDSLQNKQFFHSPKTEVYLTNITELRSGKQDLFYKDKQILLEMKRDLEYELAGNEGITTTVNPFHPTTVSYETPIKLFVIIFGVLYFAFIIIASIIKYRKRIIEFLNEH